MGNKWVKITYRTGKYAPVNEYEEEVVSSSEEQAVHDLITKFLHFNPGRKIKIMKTEVLELEER